MTLNGKRALVTGAGRGIGAGIAEALAAAGADVAINARSDTYLGPLVERLRQEHGARIHAVAGDATQAEGCRELIARAEALMGGVDILVNALGDAIVKPLVALPGGEGDFSSDDDVAQTLAINLGAAIHASRAAAPGMIARRWGRIITITAGYGPLRGQANLAIYSAGKAGLVGLSRSLAQEWGRWGITVNMIAPGVFPDPDHMPPETLAWIDKEILPQIPLGRLGGLKEIGPIAVMLASDAGAYITGHQIVVDGGLFA